MKNAIRLYGSWAATLALTFVVLIPVFGSQHLISRAFKRKSWMDQCAELYYDSCESSIEYSSNWR